MAKNYFNRYVWLIDVIRQAGHITLADISRKWEHSSLNDEGGPLPERTFHNHRQAILDIFGIELKNDRALGYYIDSSEDMEADGIRQWMLESMSLSNLLSECGGMREQILFENIPSSQKWIIPIVNAMKDRKAIEMTYQSFNRPEPHVFIAHVYCLKLFKQRWYVLARSEQYAAPRIYALDRILNVEPCNRELEIPAGFNARDFFSNYFGIIVGEEPHAQLVRIKVFADQVKYFETLPLHHSQQVEECGDGYSIFRYWIDPTFDFKQELLGRGPKVEVLEPEWFRKEIRTDIKKMGENYE